ncbi:MAG TPA: hypothetical protein VF608_09030, partial [Thermoanaerobaculia bacterium]
MSAWRNAATYTSSAVTAAIVATAVLTVFALMIHPLLIVPVLIVGIVLVALASVRATNKRRVHVTYRLDAAAQKAFESMSHGVGWLANSRAVWRVLHEETLQRPANTKSVTRVPAQILRDKVANLLTNISVPSIVGGGETVIFLPNAFFVRRHAGAIEDVPYASIRVDVETTQFSESGHVPGDSKRAGTSWQYANKDGSPDRRRANNAQIPILEYARVTVSWRNYGCVFLVSNVDAARHFAKALQTMAKPKETAMPAQIPTASNDLVRALQNSIDRKKRLDELQRQSAAAPVETKPVTNAEWLGTN